MKDIFSAILAWLALALIPIGALAISWVVVCFVLWLITFVLGMHFFLDLATVVWLLLVLLFLCVRTIIAINKELKD